MSEDQTKAVVHVAPDSSVTVTATNVAGVPHMQQGILDWARGKLAIVNAETESLKESVEIAGMNGFKRSAFETALDRSRKLGVYYSKIVAALEAGYCLFPTMSDASVFAVRTTRKNPNYQSSDSSIYGQQRDPADRTVPPSRSEIGEGRYVANDPHVYFTTVKGPRQRPDGTSEEVSFKRYFSEGFKEEMEFPLEMAKPEIMSAVGEAMAKKIFDEISVTPQDRTADPIIVGTVVHPKSKRRVSFLIAWAIDTRTI